LNKRDYGKIVVFLTNSKPKKKQREKEVKGKLVASQGINSLDPIKMIKE
jgi:hypothetical protein